jgi:uncharacterized membrane protein
MAVPLTGSDLLMSPLTRMNVLISSVVDRFQRVWDRATGDEGVILVVTVMMLPVILGFIGIMLDGALLYAARRELQDAADAAALAGAMQIDLQYFADTGVWRLADATNIDGAQTAHQAAQEVCGIYGVTCTTEVLPDYDFRTFRVRAETTKHTVFIQFLVGTSAVHLDTTATSVMVPGF